MTYNSITTTQSVTFTMTGPTPTPTPTGVEQVAIDYSYDPLYRLTRASYSGSFASSYAYSYDAVGNRLSVASSQSPVVSYTYDAANRLTSVNGQTYTWDNNGNLTSDGLLTYSYDQANRLKQVTQGANTYTFAYNGVGDRLSQTVGITTTRYVLDPSSGLTQVLADGTNTYLYGPSTGSGQASRLAQYQAEMQYFGADGLGSVRQIYDATGQVLATNRYDPYGSLMSLSGAATSVFGYTGEQYDSYIKLLYLRARWYDPTQGRFTTRDEWEGDYNTPLTLNRWNYVKANPTNLTDPSGNVSESERFYLHMLYDNIIRDTANRLNVRSLTNMSTNGFAAMIGGKILMEDATIFADNHLRGWKSDLSTFALLFLRKPYRDWAEKNIPDFEKEISWGPGNIPLAQQIGNLKWWEEKCTSYDLMLEDLLTNYYSMRKKPLGDTESTIIRELWSNQGAVEAIALSILRSAERASEYWLSQGETSKRVTAYDIALGQVAWTIRGEDLYPIKYWTGKGSHYWWVIAMEDAAEIFGFTISVPSDYVPWTAEEKRRLDELP